MNVNPINLPEALQREMEIRQQETDALKDQIKEAYPSLDVHATVWEWNGKIDATVGLWFNHRCVAAVRTWEDFEAVVNFSLALTKDHYRDFDPFNASPTEDELNKY